MENQHPLQALQLRYPVICLVLLNLPALQEWDKIAQEEQKREAEVGHLVEHKGSDPDYSAQAVIGECMLPEFSELLES
eukprot:EC718841.1.p1 GENE.EC718841.1~~EC718841.1.p1  ORF type:complete len:78 (-),score=11.90 EC718841.1:47-280(-)